jgi:hypothetical protein
MNDERGLRYLCGQYWNLPTALLFALLAAVCVEATAEDDSYRVPRLGNGVPDLQGVWDHIDPTPLERPVGVDTLVISREQADRIHQALEAMAEDRAIPTEPTEYFNERRPLPIRGELRSSIVTDPADGRIPGTEVFKRWMSTARSNMLNAMDGPEQRPTSERCLGNTASQPPNLYNPGTNLHQIVQTEREIMFVSEVMHDARVIRLNASHAPAAVTSWLGDSVARWEKDTLVVETKYFTSADTGRLAMSVAFLVSPRTIVTERITRVSRNELNYSFTVEDPDLYTKPWSGETHFHRTDDRLFEYACHEGNRAITDNLTSARHRDATVSAAAQR